MDSLDSSSRSSSSEDIEFLNRNRDRAGDNNHDGDTIENLDNDNDAEQPVVAPPPNPEGSSSRAVGRQANGQGGRGGAVDLSRGIRLGLTRLPLCGNPCFKKRDIVSVLTLVPVK